MRYLAPFLLLGLLACDSASTRVSPTNPAADSRLTMATVPIAVELFSDEFCKGGNVWWNARFNVFGAGALDKCEIRVYTIDPNGVWSFFGVAKAGVSELEGTDYQFYAEGIAPPDSIPDLHQAGYPANYGFVPFGFNVYVGTKHTLVGTTSQYSDITITSNLFAHQCK